MILIDGIPQPFERAVNTLNFDKRGNPTGLDSLGILVSISDHEENPLELFIGLKYDVLSIHTNRSVTTFINLEEEHKAHIGENSCTLEFDLLNSIEFFIDVHKVQLDMRMMYSYVYGCVESMEAFNSMLDENVYKTFGKKSARLISMHPTRQFEGNLELIGLLVSESREMFIANELIIPRESLADEVVYTNWFVPRDLKSYDYSTGNNVLKFEEGDETADGLGGVTIANGSEINTFSYDRRTFRNGYMNLLATDPYINAGFRLNNIQHAGTYFTRDVEPFDENISLSRFDIESIPGEPWLDRILILASVDYISQLKQIDKTRIKLNVFKYMISNGFSNKGLNSWKSFFGQQRKKDVIDSILRETGNSSINILKKEALVSVFDKTFVPFLYAGNILRNDTVVAREDTYSSIVFVYHPVLSKYFFYEVEGSTDSGIRIENGVTTVTANGFTFGLDTTLNYGRFIWNNINKDFRKDKKEISFTDAVVEDADREYSFTLSKDGLTDNMSTLGTYMDGYDDLTYNGKTAKVFILKKDDVLDIIRKRFGVCDSRYAFGEKYGYIEVK